MITSLIRKAGAGPYSAGEITTIAKNDFEVVIGLRRVQQIISDTPLMKYLKKLRAPRFSFYYKIHHVYCALKYIEKDQNFWALVIFSDENRF